ncbi:hypothetical protein BGW41_007534 [Actinomortierella wolfii]|nr:hypothetical protein BGW41_007534 [Actinomortierella wolfii]
MTDSRPFYCQRCNQQLRIDDSLQDINSAAFDLLLGPLSDSNGRNKGGSKTYNNALGPDEARKAAAGEDSAKDTAGKGTEASHRHHPHQQHREAMFTRTIPPNSPSTRRGGPGTGLGGVAGAGADSTPIAASTINFGTSESFVVLPKGSGADVPRGHTPSLGYARSHASHPTTKALQNEGGGSPAAHNNLNRSASTPSPAPWGAGGASPGGDHISSPISSTQPYGAYQPAALAIAQNEANKDRMTRTSRAKTKAKLFDLMSGKSDIDHPLCQECCDMLIEVLAKQLRDVSRERDCYIDFLRTVNSNVISSEEMEELEREIEQIQLDEKASIQALRDIEQQQEAVKAEIAKLEEEAVELDKEEERYWQECNEFQIALQSFHDERDSLNLKYDYDTRQLEKLHKANVYNDIFCIGQDGRFATINGFRLGRLPDQPVEWPEINAAWGQTLLLLHTVASKLNFTFKTYKLVPLGSFSRIDKIEGDKASFELYGSGDYAIGRMFHNRRFDQAMVAYLNCLQQLGDYAQQHGPKLAFPYKINKDKIGDASIKLQFNQDETWTRALRYTLINTKASMDTVVVVGSTLSADFTTFVTFIKRRKKRQQSQLYQGCPVENVERRLMNNRQQELEKKRLRLAELRRARQERQEALRGAQQSESPSSTGTSSITARREIDEFVQQVLRERERSTTPTATLDGSSDAGSERGVSTTTLMSPPPYSSTSSQLPATVLPAGARIIPEFTSVDTVVFDIPPKERVVYNKEVQTVEGSFEPQGPSEEEIREQIREEFAKQEQARLEELERERLEKEAQEQQELPELTDEERKAILQSVEFSDFVEHSSKVIERAMSEKYDFMKDYTLGLEDTTEDTNGNRVRLVCSFYDDRWCKNRSVTDVGWSRKHPELVVSSYNKNPLAVNEPDGIVCVWNIHLDDRPEFVFHSQSDVLTTRFSDFHPNLIIGGTYSGQILLWDTRAKSLPVLKTHLSVGGHTHPVYAMDMVGTQNAHNLISVSTDGTVCSWQLDMLAQPLETLSLDYQGHQITDEIAVTALGFPDGETNSFWVGTEEGAVYQASRYARAGSQAGINSTYAYRGHHGPITGLHFHPLFGPMDFSDLYLTCSVDWTVKLWRKRTNPKPATPDNAVVHPLYSFESAEDYVYDVKWSPTHPAIFASVEGSGKFDVWNLNVDTEVPVITTIVGAGKALNKLNWSKDGRHAAIGSSDGHVYIYDIGEMATPKNEDWNTLQRTVNEMITTQVHGSIYGGVEY